MADKQYEPTHPCWCRSRRAPRWVVPARLLRSHGFDCCVVSEKLSSSEWRNRLSAHIYEIIIGHLNDATAESKRYDQMPVAAWWWWWCWYDDDDDMMDGGRGRKNMQASDMTWHDMTRHRDSLTPSTITHYYHSLTHLLTHYYHSPVGSTKAISTNCVTSSTTLSGTSSSTWPAES